MSSQQLFTKAGLVLLVLCAALLGGCSEEDTTAPPATPADLAFFGPCPWYSPPLLPDADSPWRTDSQDVVIDETTWRPTPYSIGRPRRSSP
jgi:hypothetical protein